MKSHSITLLLALTVLAILPCLAQDTSEPTAAQAIELYDAGRYAEAGRLLELMDARGELDGSLLYRLYYCQQHANDPRSGETLARSIAPLERDAAAADDLEAAFYLINAYSSLGRREEARTMARQVTQRIESGAVLEPASGTEQFRLGKLYADGENVEQAERWFAAALESFTAEEGSEHEAYVKWAVSYMADASYDREDFVAAEQYYGRLIDLQQPTMAGLDRLAVVRARAGLYAAAGKTWRRAELLDPANANRARYCYRLAETAETLDSLSAAAPDGRLWTQLNREDLEQTLQEQFQAVRAVGEQIETAQPLSEEDRQRFQATFDTIRPIFVAAGLEYAIQGHSIREAAFFGGYAPLIFKESAWQARRR
jgi:tetratricopeptide (TPR) repeat protein